jgi:DNA-binding transcriptional LysR family regulator
MEALRVEFATQYGRFSHCIDQGRRAAAIQFGVGKFRAVQSQGHIGSTGKDAFRHIGGLIAHGRDKLERWPLLLPFGNCRAQLVSQGMGVALVPQAMRNAALRGAVFRPLDRAVVPSEAYGVWRRGPTNVLVERLLHGVTASIPSGL